MQKKIEECFNMLATRLYFCRQKEKNHQEEAKERQQVLKELVARKGGAATASKPLLFPPIEGKARGKEDQFSNQVLLF